LHQHSVDPLAELESDRFQRSHCAEAETFMQHKRSRVLAIADNGKHLPPWSLLAPLDQFREQRSADAETV
jgi:hypothetical protein